eukprot:NODE_2261_length_956_cov_48.435502_g1862_i0.p1 GENE.NODE_2261_length_956_cov_48.435502_g1862_i0~~NODE_2261_length_956_cov_48.435502_g1862_i0.p1  ORF type:complete len:163 (+),score=29.28 NODE_2261_length_956_cov_48.435502_g1862_i0:64-489(+)
MMVFAVLVKKVLTLLCHHFFIVQGFNKSRALSWAKIPLIVMALQRYPTVLYMDTDAVFFTTQPLNTIFKLGHRQLMHFSFDTSFHRFANSLPPHKRDIDVVWSSKSYVRSKSILKMGPFNCGIHIIVTFLPTPLPLDVHSC